MWRFQTIRTTVSHSMLVISSYMNDQLRVELQRDELVGQGRMTQEQADQESEEWIQVSVLVVYFVVVWYTYIYIYRAARVCVSTWGMCGRLASFLLSM
jgi:hypothetical protein